MELKNSRLIWGNSFGQPCFVFQRGSAGLTYTVWKESGDIDLNRPIKEIWDQLGASHSGQTVLQGMAEVTQPLFNETKGISPA